MTGRLYRRGTARVLFYGEKKTSADRVDELIAALLANAGNHDVDPTELFVAEELARMSPWLSESSMRTLVVAILVTIIAERNGSTRVPLTENAGGYLAALIDELLAGSGIASSADALAKELQRLTVQEYFGRIIGDSEEKLPLVVHQGCLYSQRFFAAEQHLIRLVDERLCGAAPALELSDATARAIAASPYELSQEQQQAVQSSLERPIAAISGGPGTGKTAVSATIAQAALLAGMDPALISLAAPTGRAAQNLHAALARGCADAAAIAPAQTIHRLLGYRPQGGFRHHRDNPLPARLVIVDEASMIGLSLMERLLAALSGDCHLVLLGDSEQLPSVEAGAVFRDIVRASAQRPPKERFASRLTRSYRLDDADPGARAIAVLAEELRAGETSGLETMATTLLPKLETSGVCRLVGDVDELAAELADCWIAKHFLEHDYGALADHVFHSGETLSDPDLEHLRRLDVCAQRAKVLTATRHDRRGSLAWSERLHRSLRRGLGSETDELCPGEPITITTNDYRLGLFNGDSGVVIQTVEHGIRHLRVAFAGATGRARIFPREALAGISELGLATTVHRAQGSEFDHVAVSFPRADVPLLCRELLYTAITRARRSVTLLGEPDSYSAAAGRSLRRFSGIAEGLMTTGV